MFWEAQLKLYKKMFRMCNWKSPATTVAKHWATKSVMHYRDPNRASWYENEVVPSSEYCHTPGTLMKTSDLMNTLCSRGAVENGFVASRVVSSRFLRSVTRGRAELKLNDWVLCEERGKPATVCQITEMAEIILLATSDAALVRMWCTKCVSVYPAMDRATRQECYLVPDAQERFTMLVSFESMSVTPVSRSFSYGMWMYW